MSEALLDAAPAPSVSPVLSPAIQLHLGHRLAEAYERCTLDPIEEDTRLQELIERLEKALAPRSGKDEAAFRAAFLEMMPRLQKFAMSLARDPAVADDLVQDTLLRGWRSRARFEAGTNLGAWLFTIMRNAFYSRHRKNSRELSDTDGTHAERLATVPEQGGHLDLKDLQTAMQTLPQVMREALILVAIENLSYDEAAQVMRCRIGTVKSRVWRAREQLARTLGFDATNVGADDITLSIIEKTSSLTHRA